MATYSIEKLSGSVDGKGIKVTGTTVGTAVTIHTVGAGANDIEVPELWVVNTDTVERELTLGWGGTTDPDNLIPLPIAPRMGPVHIATELILMNGLSVVAFGAVANVLHVYGRVFKVDK